MSAGASANPANRSGWLTYENGILLLLGTSFGLVFFDRNTINYLATDIVTDLGLSIEQLNLLGSGLSVAWALSAYFVGAWSDRVGVRKPFVLGSIILAFAIRKLFRVPPALDRYGLVLSAEPGTDAVTIQCRHEAYACALGRAKSESADDGATPSARSSPGMRLADR